MSMQEIRYIEDNPDDPRGKYYLLIERSDWISNDLDELEAILWAMAYIHFDPASYERLKTGRVDQRRNARHLYCRDLHGF